MGIVSVTEFGEDAHWTGKRTGLGLYSVLIDYGGVDCSPKSVERVSLKDHFPLVNVFAELGSSNDLGLFVVACELFV